MGGGAQAKESVAEEPAPRERSSGMRSILRNTLRALLGLTVGLVLAEVAFCVRDGGAFPHLNVYAADASRGVRLRPGATEKVSFSNNPITSVRINDQGYRGGAWPPAGPDEVVVVGDSQVFGLGVEENETFSVVLQGALGGGRVVRNLGVPTYGPDEYNAALDEALARRPAKTVIYVVNLANDLFEANRPNRERHAVWDGWAVRKETAPASVIEFPGRALLYSRSHAFYALRRFLYDRGPKLEERGFESEGTWKDIGGAASAAEHEHAITEQENERLARLRDSEIRYTTDGVAVTQTAVEDHVVETAHDKLAAGEPRDYETPNWMSNAEAYRAAKLSPGDIVTIQSGESSRDVRVTAEQIRRGAALRLQIEKGVREGAEAKKDEGTLGLFAKRDEVEHKSAALKAMPFPKVVALSPLTPALRAAQAICERHGARLLVVALPIDVQVSKAEWAKYGSEPLDMESSKILLDDVVAAAQVAGAEGFDATPALAAAEPGAFLAGDIHMTPKGHKALGDAIAKALRGPKLDLPGGVLPAGRAAPPEGFVLAARRARDAAQKLVATCTLEYRETEDGLAMVDVCRWTHDDDVAFGDAASALRLLADSEAGTSLLGPAATFVEELRLFGDWVALVRDLPRRGTLAHYQELALAWNAWRSDEAIAIDPIKAKFPMRPRVDAGADGGDAGRLRWERCVSGPCMRVEER